MALSLSDLFKSRFEEMLTTSRTFATPMNLYKHFQSFRLKIFGFPGVEQNNCDYKCVTRGNTPKFDPCAVGV